VSWPRCSSTHSLSPEAVAPWIEILLRLAAGEGFYQEHSRRARETGRIYEREALAARYVEYSRSVVAAR
jgi:hypothetical protein